MTLFLPKIPITFLLSSSSVWSHQKKKKIFVFDDLSCFFKCRTNIYSFFNINHLKSNDWIILCKTFSSHFSWMLLYHSPVIFIYKSLIFWYSLRVFPLSLWFDVTVAAIRRIYIWSKTFSIYFMTFLMYQISTCL